MFKVFFISLIVAFLFLSGCQKDELTLPANVSFIFEMKAFELEDEKEDEEDETKHAINNLKADYSDNPFDDDFPFNDNESDDFKSLKIDKSTLVITAIEIDGKRELGKDAFLKTNFDPPLEIKLGDGELSDHELSFDIPQGIYEKLDIWFYLGTDKKPAINFEGSFTWEKSPGIGFQFRHLHEEYIQVRGKSNKTSEPIVLNKEKKSKAHVIVDARYMFRNIKFEHLAGTKLINIPGGNGKVIRIDQHNNNAVFKEISGRLEKLEKSITVVFE